MPVLVGSQAAPRHHKVVRKLFIVVFSAFLSYGITLHYFANPSWELLYPKEMTVADDTKNDNIPFDGKAKGDDNSMQPVLPNVLLIGAQKAGTTALASWMIQSGACHGWILPSEPFYYVKEMTFFGSDERYAKGIEFYMERYNQCAGKGQHISLDATPSTMLYPERVHETYHHARGEANRDSRQFSGTDWRTLKIIASLREPLARELSLYNHKLSLYKSKPSPNAWYSDILRNQEALQQNNSLTPEIYTFDDLVEEKLIKEFKKDTRYVWSHYARFLREWFRLFDPSQILVLSYEQDIKNTTNGKRTREKIKQFLEWPTLQTQTTFPKVNTNAGSHKSHTMTCRSQDQLQSIFQSWNEELYILLANTRGVQMVESVFPRFELPECHYQLW